MLIVLALIIVFHLASAALLFAATIYNSWWVVSTSTENVYYSDLWFTCNETCYSVAKSHTADAAYLQTVQATMILSTILCCMAFFVFILQLFRLRQGERFVFTAIIQLLASVCVMVAASVYTAQKDSFHEPKLRAGTYSSSFYLAWASFPMTLLSGIMYLVLRKRK
ncbi:unnamed protein product [Boreogadus saida]|uniref:Epithelial membrane protein 2 n=1 Tax=Gadus morhua TaxID=8049 RepID=A0A8C5C4P9_GADMO|nr:epithelial membrane protein 2 [Gadus morhua]XP_056461439.1 epithelial membrane protein 2 [Gadus chalcogrammus]XP_056461449.1 epithelial membrane protein 2 [Gadus chalcogrammus]XP_059930134.1 epithelial membrane protein 2 [Gadus macrocephalus]